MYCFYCGGPAVGSCPVCGRNVCPRHRRGLLGLPVCRRCRPQIAAGCLVLIALAAAGWLLLHLIR